MAKRHPAVRASGRESVPKALPIRRRPARPRHPFLAAAVAAVLGVGTTAAGAGIGIRYLQKTGLTVETVAGLALLAIGLALLGYAGTVAWKVLRGWWRLVLLPAAVVALQLVLSGSLAFALAVVPPTALGSGTPADQGLRYRDVAFETRDGVRLSAWLVPTRNGAAVVMAHGSGSTRTSTLRQAGVLGRAGYGLLLVDARGHGRSAGSGMDAGWYGDQDLTAAADFLSRQPGVNPGRIGVLGLSMGGEEAIGATAAEPRIRAVVAEGVTGRTAADTQPFVPGGAEGVVERTVNLLTYGLLRALTPAPEPTPLRDAVVTARHTDFLVISGGKEPEEGLAAARLHAAAPSRVKVWTVTEAAHTGAINAAPARWRSEVLGFLDAHLGE